MMRKYFVLSLLLIAFTSIVFGQGEFQQRGQNSLGVSVGFATNEDAFAYGGGIGFSILGVFDIGMGVNRVNPKDTDKDIYMIDFAPFISIHLIKQRFVFVSFWCFVIWLIIK